MAAAAYIDTIVQKVEPENLRCGNRKNYTKRQPIATIVQKVKTEKCEVVTAKNPTTRSHPRATARPPKNTTTQPQQAIIIINILGYSVSS